MRKLLWPLIVVNLNIPGLIWRGSAYFVQNNTTIILPGDTQRTTSELRCRVPVTHFWHQNRNLETQNVSYFSLFANWYGFWMVFEYVKRCLISKPFLTCLLDVRTLDFSYLLNPDWSIQIFRAPAECKAEEGCPFGRKIGQMVRWHHPEEIRTPPRVALALTVGQSAA